jgi:hypothetical protein
MYYETYRQILLDAENKHKIAIVIGSVNCIIKAVRRWLALVKIRKSIANKKDKENKKVTFNKIKTLVEIKEEVVLLVNDIDIRINELKEKLNEI